jgi:hypothetical protein
LGVGGDGDSPEVVVHGGVARRGTMALAQTRGLWRRLVGWRAALSRCRAHSGENGGGPWPEVAGGGEVPVMEE